MWCVCAQTAACTLRYHVLRAQAVWLLMLAVPTCSSRLVRRYPPQVLCELTLALAWSLIGLFKHLAALPAHGWWASSQPATGVVDALSHPCVCCCPDLHALLPAGILQQRCAGPLYCYEAWSKWHKQAEDDLQEEMERLARPKGQAKGGKGVKEREQQDSKTKERLDQVTLFWGCCGGGVGHHKLLCAEYDTTGRKQS